MRLKMPLFQSWNPMTGPIYQPRPHWRHFILIQTISEAPVSYVMLIITESSVSIESIHAQPDCRNPFQPDCLIL